LDALEKIEEQIRTKDLRLNLGCGNLRKSGYVGVDISLLADVDIRCDVIEFLTKLPNNCVKAVYSRMFFEHLSGEQLAQIIKEIDRVLVAGGTLEVTVPHYTNPYQYADPTHRSCFAVHTFDYFCENSPHFRKVPSYCRVTGWTLEKTQLKFVPFFRGFSGIPIPSICDLLNIFVNASSILVELYERYLSCLFSIYQITFFVKKS
jgi:hypothetical protein